MRQKGRSQNVYIVQEHLNITRAAADAISLMAIVENTIAEISCLLGTEP